MSDTPLTDYEAEYWLDPAMSGETQIVTAEFCRKIERKLVWLTERWERAANAYLIEQGRTETLQRELEQERAQIKANHKATKLIEEMLYAERALADRLAKQLEECAEITGDFEAITAWKEARK